MGKTIYRDLTDSAIRARGCWFGRRVYESSYAIHCHGTREGFTLTGSSETLNRHSSDTSSAVGEALGQLGRIVDRVARVPRKGVGLT